MRPYSPQHPFQSSDIQGIDRSIPDWSCQFMKAISPPREGINVLDESEIKPGESCIGEKIPLLAEEWWTRHEENVPLPIWRGRGGQFGAIFRPEDCAKLTTPSAALRWL